jgi:hypothetical protein
MMRYGSVEQTDEGREISFGNLVIFKRTKVLILGIELFHEPIIFHLRVKGFTQQVTGHIMLEQQRP